MIEIYKGHLYRLENLRDDGYQVLQFQQDVPLHEEKSGCSCQEVLRALVKRVEALDSELRWKGNDDILFHLRSSIALFEGRALQRKVEKGAKIEDWPVGPDGHLSP